MDYRTLGRTNIKVSSLCLGTMTFGEQTSEADGFAQMDYSIANGINFFDTAELYSIPPKAATAGSTETIIGNWFQSRKSRDKVILATKVVGRSAMNWFRADKSPSELSRQQIEEAVNASLRRLKTDYIDLYQIHWPDREVVGFGSVPTVYEPPKRGEEHTILSILEVMGDLVKAGKIRHLGLSNESPWGVMSFLKESEKHNLPRVQSVQNSYSLINRMFETGLAEIADREDTKLMAYSPLAQGYLTGKYQNGALPVGSRKQLFNRLQRYEKPGSSIAVDAYLALARELGVDLTHLALAFVTSRPFLYSNIIGATTLDQLKHIFGSLNVKITPEINKRINEIHQLHMNPAC